MHFSLKKGKPAPMMDYTLERKKSPNEGQRSVREAQQEQSGVKRERVLLDLISFVFDE